MLLSAATVGSYLIRRGLLPDGTGISVEELGGGVSNVVLAVQAGGFDVVVKQALPRLRVADEWQAKRERALTEAGALGLARRSSGDSVPPVHDVDEDACAITIERAPRHWGVWKQQLLEGRIDTTVASRLGALLADWHGLDVSAAGWLDDPEAFEQLRVEPYYRTVVLRCPGIADEVVPLIERMGQTRRCLVHGDFSPKNVLVGSDGMWVIDFEVAHLGDPAFDVAFLLSHLVLKAIHRPDHRDAYAACALGFHDAYLERMPDGWYGETSYVIRHLGALLLARVIGKSPVEYLAPGERDTAQGLGTSLLVDPPAAVGAVWRRLAEDRDG